MADTTNLILPLMSASQSQKHLTHNDAIIKLDAIVQLAVTSMTLTAPPGSPVEGDRYIIGSGATGAWATKDLNVVYYTSGAWVFLIPREGWIAWDEATADIYIWTGAAWESYSSAAGTLSLADLSDGSTVTLLGIAATPDSTNRLSVRSPSVLFNAETDDINVTLNKAAAGDDARFTFQTNFSTRALFGLLANDDFSISVSPNGSSFFSAMAIDKDTGNVAIGAGSDGTNKLLVSGSNMLFTSSGSLGFTFNKNASGDDCALTFQTGFSARALVGLLGDDNYTFKVSTDGSSYKTGMIIYGASGRVSFQEHPKFSCYCNFGQTYAAGWTDMTANIAQHNDQGDLVIASNIATFTAPHDGYYMFGAGATLETGGAPTAWQIGISVNNATPASDTISAGEGDASFVTLESGMSTTALLKLTAGQTVKAKINITGGGRITANRNYFWGCQIA